MKKLFLLLFILPFTAFAQKDYKTHTVGPKENLSSIGRLYSINGRELANYNNIDYEKGLTIGQVLKIPVKPGSTVVQTPVPEKPVDAKPILKQTQIPIYHTVEKKQTLYAISKLYNTTVDNIKKWNNFTVDGLSEGAKIIVGYSGATNKITPPVTADKEPEQPKPVPVVTKKEETPRTQPVTDVAKSEAPVVKKENNPATAVKPGNFNSGIFKTDYDDQAKANHTITESGNGGIFKSNSGWQDGKYYCLHNMATPGTIIKITNNTNGKSVYAKVLDLMPDIKQNNGLIICVSNAAAGVLGITTDKIDCTLNYTK